MSKVYQFGLIGRRFLIDKKLFHGWKSFSSKSVADKNAAEARNAGYLARVIPPERQGGRYVVAVSVEKRR